MALSEKELHVGRYYDAAKRRAQSKGIPFNLTLKYLRSIATNFCPVFNTPLEWGRSKMGRGKMLLNGAQLDRIIPELGYVIGNVAFISHRANRIKDNGTMQEHYDIADWIWNHTHADKKSTTSLSTGDHQQSQDDSQHGTLPATRTGQDNNHPDHHSGAIPGKDIDHRAKTGSGNSLGHRNKEVEPSITLTRIENNGEPDAEIVRLEFGRRDLFD
jgi:hypothetical protein